MALRMSSGVVALPGRQASQRRVSRTAPVAARRSRTACVRAVAFKSDVEVEAEQAVQASSQFLSQFQYSVKPKMLRKTGNPLVDFITKVNLAYNIFFPPTEAELTPKEEVKKRLRMVLVADRCGMTPASLTDMKKSIVRALQDFVDIEGEEGIEVCINNEPGVGTVYSVNIPVRRVKADQRFEGLEGVTDGDVVTLQWDPSDYNSDPSSRFPMGC